MSLAALIRQMVASGVSVEHALVAAEARETHPSSHAAVIRALVNTGATTAVIMAYAEVIEREKAEGVACKEHGRVLPSDWRERRRTVFERDGWRCTYCGTATDAPHCDHVMPLSRGGSSDFDNLTTACPSCNTSKSDKTPDEWRRACL